MGYQALLFCPDEKTARIVTQVLSELEFDVEPCMEPFAAVKKLMGQHFDAVVVDCDNDQNATLLFKSARNSASNQASLAVAVVEGQPGVAKAFRIGANLVLTKPINLEQAKGTLRVARGLLRKSEPAKPAAANPAAPASDVKSPTTGPAPAAKLTASAASAAISPPAAKPAASPAWPTQSAAASSTSAAQDEDVLEIGLDDSVAAPAPPAPKLPAPAVRAAAPEAKLGFTGAPEGAVTAFGSGAASAPAPAREGKDSHVPEASPASAPHKAESLFEKAVDATRAESSASAAPAPAFTFGGANLPAESSSGSKKALLAVAAAVLVTIGVYAGWRQFHGKTTQPVNPVPAPVAAQETPKPRSAQSASVARPVSTSSPGPQPVVQTPLVTAPATDAVEDSGEPASEEATPSAAPASKNPASSVLSPAGKAASAAKPAAQPLVVKGGKAQSQASARGAADAPAPEVIGMATPGSGGSLPDIPAGGESAVTPVLQALNISQGVSQGLLIKKVQPVYPRNALNMHIEGAVALMATISKTGTITSVKVLSGEPTLTRAAADAVKQWKYKPYLLNGEPVEIQTQITINFKLPR